MADTADQSISNLVESVNIIHGISKEKKKPYKAIQIEFKNGIKKLLFVSPELLIILENELKNPKTDDKKSFLDD